MSQSLSQVQGATLPCTELYRSSLFIRYTKSLIFLSGSILVISPQNRVLLLRRVQNSTSFPSAHVFPGGHVDLQDGALPPPSDFRCHEDSLPYRQAAIRECFEESGILLAHPENDTSSLIELSDQLRHDRRKAVHAQETSFSDFLARLGATTDISGLIPFTRWVTPSHLTKRYTTQMYLYFLPMKPSSLTTGFDKSQQFQIPTTDGGIEHNEARFLYPMEWIDLSLRREITLFPPQFVLLSLIAQFLPSHDAQATSTLDFQALDQCRQNLKHWVTSSGDPPWSEKCISPGVINKVKNKYMILGLGEPGPELEGSMRKGDQQWVLKVELDRAMEKGQTRPLPFELCKRSEFCREHENAKI